MKTSDYSQTIRNSSKRFSFWRPKTKSSWTWSSATGREISQRSVRNVLTLTRVWWNDQRVSEILVILTSSMTKTQGSLVPETSHHHHHRKPTPKFSTTIKLVTVVVEISCYLHVSWRSNKSRMWFTRSMNPSRSLIRNTRRRSYPEKRWNSICTHSWTRSTAWRYSDYHEPRI